VAEVVVIGGGLAGSEAAWQAAVRGVRVTLHEMRPAVQTPAHHTGDLAELVCSNSFKSDSLDNAPGMLKAEMRCCGSLILACAQRSRIPAGKALAVDREGFARLVTGALETHANVEIRRGEVREIPPIGPTVIATGPLTSDALAESLRRLTGSESLAFFDAAAPVLLAESVDGERAFFASRYDKGDADYLNCPLDEAEYERFYHALIAAEQHPCHDFEAKTPFFEACLPVEELARRGKQTLLYGPMKPVGLRDPRTGEQPFAVVQLRRDNAAGTLYNMVGFQTNLRHGEQRRVFSLIPALRNAEFMRYGEMHRNTYINSPRVLMASLQMRSRPDVLIAGQLTGVEGYIESAAMGLVAGINAARLARGQSPLVFPAETAIGGLTRYIISADADAFQPMNINYGLMPALNERIRNKKARNEAFSRRGLSALDKFRQVVGLAVEDYTSLW